MQTAGADAVPQPGPIPNTPGPIQAPIPIWGPTVRRSSKQKQNASSSWWPKWMPFWQTEEPKTMKSTDAIRDETILQRFQHFLHHTDPPASFKASDVAKELSYNELVALGYESWKEALPAVVELAFELREAGDCELIKGGQVLGDDVEVYDVGTAVRIRRIV